MAAVAQHLADKSGAHQRWGTRVTRANWSPEVRQWSLSGTIGVHKDSARNGSVEDLGSFDSLVIADAAALRSGSAGQVTIDASSPGTKTLTQNSHAIHLLTTQIAQSIQGQ